MDESKEEERMKHPSFGQISFSRISGGSQKFYGSELPQDHYITMSVTNSEINRTLSRDWYHPSSSPIVRIRMTAGQFSELITSLNTGSGTPCTIEVANKTKVEEYPDPEGRKEFVHRKFEERMRKFAKTLVTKQLRVKELSAKKTLSKADQQELNFTVEWLTQEVASNIPFFAKCFQETMDEVVFEAKTEVENAIQHRISVLGMEELHKQNKLLNNS